MTGLSMYGRDKRDVNSPDVNSNIQNIEKSVLSEEYQAGIKILAFFLAATVEA